MSPLDVIHSHLGQVHQAVYYTCETGSRYPNGQRIYTFIESENLQIPESFTDRLARYNNSSASSPMRLTIDLLFTGNNHETFTRHYHLPCPEPTNANAINRTTSHLMSFFDAVSPYCTSFYLTGLGEFWSNLI